MMINEKNYLEILRAQLLIQSILIDYLSKKDPALSVGLESSLAACENSLPLIKEPYRSELRETIVVAKRMLNEVPGA